MTFIVKFARHLYMSHAVRVHDTTQSINQSIIWICLVGAVCTKSESEVPMDHCQWHGV